MHPQFGLVVPLDLAQGARNARVARRARDTAEGSLVVAVVVPGADGKVPVPQVPLQAEAAQAVIIRDILAVAGVVRADIDRRASQPKADHRPAGDLAVGADPAAEDRRAQPVGAVELPPSIEVGPLTEEGAVDADFIGVVDRQFREVPPQNRLLAGRYRPPDLLEQPLPDGVGKRFVGGGRAQRGEDRQDDKRGGFRAKPTEHKTVPVT